MREWWRHIGVVVVACTAAAVLAGCASAPSPARTPPPKRVPFSLSTHCGVAYAQVGNRYYEATAPLTDGPGNPGTLTVISPTTAIFTDKAGHRVTFTLTPSAPARATTRVCT